VRSVVHVLLVLVQEHVMSQSLPLLHVPFLTSPSVVHELLPSRGLLHVMSNKLPSTSSLAHVLCGRHVDVPLLLVFVHVLPVHVLLLIVRVVLAGSPIRDS
jgi:hypothetical protein